MKHQFSRPYQCKRCGGSDHYVEGKHRRCRKCRTLWKEKYNAEYHSKYYRLNVEKIKEARRERYVKTRHKVLGMQAAYNEEYPEVNKRHRDKRDEKIRAGYVTRKELEAIRDRDHGRCIYCGTTVETSCYPWRVRGFDHLISLLSPDGEHAGWNLGVCCIECNADKAVTPFCDYVLRRGIKADFSKIPYKVWGLEEPIDLEDDTCLTESQ